MTRGKIRILLAASGLLLLFSGCTVIPDSPARPSSPAAGGEEINPEIRIGNAMLEAIRKEDFRAFRNCLRGGPAEELSRRDFETSMNQSRTQFGTLRKFRFLTSLQTPAVRNLIWKTEFQRKGSNGRRITQELLFRLVSGTLDGRPVVLSFGFL